MLETYAKCDEHHIRLLQQHGPPVFSELEQAMLLASGAVQPVASPMLVPGAPDS